MDSQLQQVIELLAEQNRLLKRYLWRIRFSLLTLLVLTTLVAVGLGLTLAAVHSLQQELSPEPPQSGGGIF